MYIPFHQPSIGKEEIDAVTSVLTSRWLTTGPIALEFQADFARYIGCKHALAVNSCTAALQLALDAIGLKSGHEVLVPSYTFTATAEVVTYFGARPVLCDSEPGGFNIDPADAERRITAKTRAIIPVHIAGQPCDLTAIHALADRHNLCVIEDAAHALPASHRGRRIGSISELTAFSFYTTKTITTGEGGMLVTNNDRYAERASLMRLHGIGHDAWKRYSRTGSWSYQVQEAGYKMNLPDILAALGLVQLRKCDAFRERRRAIAAFYQEKLSTIDELLLPTDADEGSQHAWHLFILRLRPQMLRITRDDFIEQLSARGIGTSVHFIPLHRHPFYIRQYRHTCSDFPQADASYLQSVSLPIYPDLSDAQCGQIVSTIRDVVTKNRLLRTVSVG